MPLFKCGFYPFFLAKADKWINFHKILFFYFFLPKGDWIGLIKEVLRHIIKCEFYSFFWPKLMNE